MLNYSESPLSQLPYLELFQRGGGGGGSQGVFWGGQSRDMFRGGPVKKISLNKEDTLVSRTQPSGPLCLWQCLIPRGGPVWDFNIFLKSVTYWPTLSKFRGEPVKKITL